MMVHKNLGLINFQAGVHNVILDPWKDPTKHAHQAGFMIIDVDVDIVV